MKKNCFIRSIILSFALSLVVQSARAESSQLYETGYPYIKYFLDQSLGEASGFKGLSRSFQFYLGGHNPADENMISYGAIAYDQDILSRISLQNGKTDILDTYVSYMKQMSDPGNPLIYAGSAYTDGGGNPLKYGPFRAVRILGRDAPNWWSGWDWVLDTGASTCMIISALEGYQYKHNNDYRDLGVLFGEYLLKLQDSDGGIRYGPRGMYHDSGPDFFWKLKSTEQNERALSALRSLYQVTGDPRYNNAASAVAGWLKSMYDKSLHLFHTAAIYNGSEWVKSDFDYVATDVMALAPIDIMYTDSYFGETQAQREQEVDLMFAAIELRTAFLDSTGMPLLFRFSISQTGEYGSVEWSAQMAIAYLRAAQFYHQNANPVKTQQYLNKYFILVNNLERFFTTVPGDPQAKIAPYASYVDGRVAGGVPTGTGYDTFNCQAALASAYYAFAKAGFDPGIIGGGPGVPQTNASLNLQEVPWYEKVAPYNSSGAAAAQMIINYMRQGAIVPYTEIQQNSIYEYAKDSSPLTGDLSPNEMDRALGHFDPYDTLISNWLDLYDSYPDGNPLQGYNFHIYTFDPASDSQAMQNYLRDICHWMAYTVTKDQWRTSPELVSRPHTPAAVALFGSFDHWGVVKGYAASANPCPEPFRDPFYTPDFTVYGLWLKDPLIDGIGRDTYKTAAECVSTYFIPVSSEGVYRGKLVQVAEPPLVPSRGHASINKILVKQENLAFLGMRQSVAVSEPSMCAVLGASPSFSLNRKRNAVARVYSWQDIIDEPLLQDKQACAAFEGTASGTAIQVKRTDKSKGDYFLVPFGKKDARGRFLVNAVVILDAYDAHFKEASWTKDPVNFLPIRSSQAIRLVRQSICREYLLQLKKLNTYPPRERARRQRDLYMNYAKLSGYVLSARAVLVWEPSVYSNSPYKPFWRVSALGYVWNVNQDSKVFSPITLNPLLREIEVNRGIMEKEKNRFSH